MARKIPRGRSSNLFSGVLLLLFTRSSLFSSYASPATPRGTHLNQNKLHRAPRYITSNHLVLRSCRTFIRISSSSRSSLFENVVRRHRKPEYFVNLNTCTSVMALKLHCEHNATEITIDEIPDEVRTSFIFPTNEGTDENARCTV